MRKRDKLMSMCLYTKNEPYWTRSSFCVAERGSRGHRPRCARPPRTPILCHGHPVQPKMKKLQSNSLFVSKHISIQQVDVHMPIYKKTSPIGLVLHFVLRRERDSNPRNLSVQRFSRPPQSTTLPSLLRNRLQNYYFFFKYTNF